MRAALAAALLTIVLLAAQSSNAGDPAINIVPGTSLGIVPRGGADGGDALYLNGGDIIGPRNLQGGGPSGSSFDIGAGSTNNPGDLVLNYDVGRRVLIFDGHKHLVASFGPNGIAFYRRPHVRRRPT
jgi:hypothetical protein